MDEHLHILLLLAQHAPNRWFLLRGVQGVRGLCVQVRRRAADRGHLGVDRGEMGGEMGSGLIWVDLARRATVHRSRRRPFLGSPPGRLLHDDLQQLLVAASLHLSCLAEGAQDERKQEFAKIDALLQDCQMISRDLSRELSPPILKHGTLADVVGWLAQWFGDKHALTVAVDAQRAVPAASEHLRVFVFRRAVGSEGGSTAKRVDCSGPLLDAKPDPCLAPDSRAKSGKRHTALADRHPSCLQPCSPSRPPPPIVWLAKDGARNRCITPPEHRTQGLAPAKPASTFALAAPLRSSSWWGLRSWFGASAERAADSRHPGELRSDGRTARVQALRCHGQPGRLLHPRS